MMKGGREMLRGIFLNLISKTSSSINWRRLAGGSISIRVVKSGKIEINFMGRLRGWWVLLGSAYFY